MSDEAGGPLLTTVTGRGLLGTGVFLAGPEAGEGGTLTAIRALSLLFLPVVPLATVRLRPVGEPPPRFEPAERRYEILEVSPARAERWIRSLLKGVAVLLAVAAPGVLTVRLLDVGSQVMGALRLVGSALLPLLVLAALDLTQERVLGAGAPRPPSG